MQALKNADAKQMLSITLQVFISVCYCDYTVMAKNCFTVINFTENNHNYTL